MRILKDFKCRVFGSADCKGVTRLFFGSADSEGLKSNWGLREAVQGVDRSVRTVNLVNTGESIIVVSRSQGLFTGSAFERLRGMSGER